MDIPDASRQGGVKESVSFAHKAVGGFGEASVADMQQDKQINWPS
jgi:hypothetical protein